MTKFLIGLLVTLVVSQVSAGNSLQFNNKIAVTGGAQAGVYLHLEGAGRRHIAYSSGNVVVTWEDDSSGDPQVYASILGQNKASFSIPILISDGVEAYEPSIAALSAGRFIVVWEQDGSVYGRTLLPGKVVGQPIRLSLDKAGNPTVTAHDDEIYVAWRQQDQQAWSLEVAHLIVDSNSLLQKVSNNSVELVKLKTPVFHPSLAAGDAGLSIAWEDRREGHTRILFSHSSDKGISFTDPIALNEFFSDRNEYDKGNGVTRVSMFSFGGDEVLAAWMDKRRRGAGYGIFSALGSDSGESFGPNEKVHDNNGDLKPHYNPAAAGNRAGSFVIAWDDFRKGTSDIWLSHYDEDDEWGLDISPVVASGKSEQSHPSVYLDELGGIHLLWLQREDVNAPGQLWYSRGYLDRVD